MGNHPSKAVNRSESTGKLIDSPKSKKTTNYGLINSEKSNIKLGGQSVIDKHLAKASSHTPDPDQGRQFKSIFSPLVLAGMGFCFTVHFSYV